MSDRVRQLLADRDSGDSDRAYAALNELFALADQPVDWAYDVWDQLVADLRHANNHKRSFSAQLLARLASSDPEGRIFRDFPALAAVMRDEKFVTARHTLQAIWRVGLAGPDRETLVLDALEARFHDCAEEKNASLVRTDIIKALRRLADATGHVAEIGERVQQLIDSEPDEGPRKKQRAAWRNPGR